ncbi:hypothetical protein NK6_2291 [Bradyrhizobium diazoefficiens]|uniref:Uncharacterized protein n=1 Tax=Bradyrhizobium diazoefficiens TaxID=1355477 RepID=A0A0E4FS85_9BRAD|nr:hypothetical protein NK6_2291 [Bradyrhizobium diazoefficiens]
MLAVLSRAQIDRAVLVDTDIDETGALAAPIDGTISVMRSR